VCFRRLLIAVQWTSLGRVALSFASVANERVLRCRAQDLNFSHNYADPKRDVPWNPTFRKARNVGHPPNTPQFAWDVKGKLDRALDWAFCGLFAFQCTDNGINTKYAISQAQGAGTDAYINSTLSLAGSVNANTVSDMNRKVCFANSPCSHFLSDCTKFAAPNPF
jgi:hypothetical protein